MIIESLLLLVLAVVLFFIALYNLWGYKQDMSQRQFKRSAKKRNCS